MTPPSPGHPFESSPLPDPVLPADTARLAPQVRAQVSALDAQCSDPTARERLARHLQDRHESVAPWRPVVGASASPSLIVAGKLMVDNAHWEQWSAAGGSLPPGISRVLPAVPGSPEAGTDVVELRVAEGPESRGMDAALRDLHAVGLQARTEPVFAAACPVGKKGDAGPIPVSSPPHLRPGHLGAHGPVPTPSEVFSRHAGRRPARPAVAIVPRPLPEPMVGIIDTGITEQRRQDGWIANIPRPHVAIDPLDALPSGPDGRLDLAAGHGTFIAGIIEQVDPELVAYNGVRVLRALDSDGLGIEEEIYRAMVLAVREGQQILSLSLGMFTDDDQPPPRLAPAVRRIGQIARERKKQVLIVAAAGNSADERPCWPAAFSGGAEAFLGQAEARPGQEDDDFVKVVAVAGLTPDLQPATWSTHGSWVDVSTVAQGICSVYVEGTEYPSEQNPQPDTYGQDPWALWSGSSFAVPQVVGALTRICHEQHLEPFAALRWLLEQGLPLDGFGRAVKILPGH